MDLNIPFTVCPGCPQSSTCCSQEWCGRSVWDAAKQRMQVPKRGSSYPELSREEVVERAVAACGAALGRQKPATRRYVLELLDITMALKASDANVAPKDVQAYLVRLHALQLQRPEVPTWKTAALAALSENETFARAAWDLTA